MSLEVHIEKKLNGFTLRSDLTAGNTATAILGASGCGKTTTLRIISGLETPDEGSVILNGKDVTDLPPEKRPVNTVFQSYALYPQMNIYDNIAFSLQVRKVPKKEIDKRVHHVAELLGLENLLKQRPKNLSGGQRQRVAMGRAIVRDPKVFLMDEPLSNLDAKLRGQMRVEISRLHQRLGTTIIYVTHDQTEAMTLGTRIVVMNGGIVQQVDTPQVLYDKPNNLFVAGFIGSPQMNFVDALCCVEGDGVILSLQDADIRLPKDKAKKLIDGGYDGKRVVLGIRPEDIHDDPEYLAAHRDTVITAKIRVYEMLGAEVFLYFDYDGANMTARVKPDTKARTNDMIDFALDPEKIHVFDKETELTITN